MKTKTFDCVAMKQECQRKLAEEYGSRRAEFSSYSDFLRAKADGSEWVKQARLRMKRPPGTARK